MIARRFRRLAASIARRLAASIVVVGVVGFGLTGCSTKSSDAATITYHDKAGDHTIHIARSEFLHELGDLVGSAPFQALLKSNGFKLAGDQRHATSSNISAIYLSQLVEQGALDAEFASLHLSLSDAGRTAAEAEVKSSFGADVYASFPKALQNVLVAQRARVDAVGAYYSAATDAKEQALYDNFATTICPSGRLVAHILVKDLATANALLAQIKSGASFADVARTSSTDSGSAQNGGSLGCLRKQAYVKEFETAAYAAQFDVPTQPVKSQYGYHIILVTHPTLAAIRSELTQALQQNPAGLLRELRMQSMKVWINPQFGSGALVVDSQQGQLNYQVTPPPAPAVRTHREKDTTTTTATTTTQPAGG